jgi:hypothetical protein
MNALDGSMSDSGPDDAGDPDAVPAGWPSREQRCGTNTLAHDPGTLLFVGGGLAGLAATLDGEDWTDATTVALGPTTMGHARNMIRGVGYGAGMFVAVGGSDNSYVSVTCDGVTWRHDVLGTNSASAPAAPYNQFLSDVAYIDGVFAAVGGNGQLLSSSDGTVTWALADSPEGPAPGLWRAVAAGSDRLVAIGNDFGNTNGISAVSSDGLTWGEVTSTAGALGLGIAYGNGVFVAVGPMRCAVSSDGEEWHDCAHGGSGNQFGAYFVNDEFVVVLSGGMYAVSPDGEDWSIVSGAFRSAMAYGDGRYVGAGSNARGFSLNRQSWTDTSTTINMVSVTSGEVK